MNMFCAGVPTDPAKVVWSDGAGKAACGASQPHGPHVYQGPARNEQAAGDEPSGAGPGGDPEAFPAD